MRRFEFSDEKSNKFWEIERSGLELTICYGKIGTAGRTQTKSLGDEAAAQKEYDKLVREKTKKGYLEVGGTPAAAESTPAEPTSAEPTSAEPTSAEPTSAKPVPTAAEEATPVEAAPAVAAPAAAQAVPATEYTLEPVLTPAAEEGFVVAEDGYTLSIQDGKIVCKNEKGTLLKSVPKKIKEGETHQTLEATLEFLKVHAQECAQTIDGWMLRSLPTPMAVLNAVWVDEIFREALENLIIAPANAEGEPDFERAGFLKGVDAEKGIGLVDLDGESRWLHFDAFFIPHPILLEDLDDWREMAAELSLSQNTKQLFREVFPKPEEAERQQSEQIQDFSSGKFSRISVAQRAARNRGYRVSGGWSLCRVYDPVLQKSVEARYWIDAGYPEEEGYSGELIWVALQPGADEESLKISQVSPIAFSEGMRMASAIYAQRTVEKED